MNILILGGTVFLGRHLVVAALERGHSVTLFNRGRHNADLFPAVEKLRGDRDGGLDVLHGRRWDAVIDTCGYVPRLVGAAATLLADQVERYVFISSISVYANASVPDQTEEAELARIGDPAVEEITSDTYGALKALSESAAETAMPNRVLTIRPGLIVGPHDPSDRFTYWPVRIAAGGDVLAPGNPRQPVQVIDARDLAAWIVRRVEVGQTGVYNATGPQVPAPMAWILELCRSVTGSDANLIWTTDAFLAAHNVGAYVELPLWLPADLYGMDQTNIDRALAAGLTFRPLAETIADTLAWHRTRSDSHRWKAGLTPAREAELLAAWQSGNSSDW